MKLSLKWLRDFIELDLNDAQNIADKLTNMGLEAESVTYQGLGLDDVVVGLIQEKQKHPDADKLSLLKVSIGSDILQIVCGANNMKEGDKVAVALIGAKLPNGLEIKKSKIRGVESFGMCCSMSELKLSEHSEGIIILDKDAMLGVSIKEALQLDDVIIELATAPNRGDVLGVLGIARELSALLGRPLKQATVAKLSDVKKGYGDLNIKIDDKRCFRYIGRYIKGVKVAQSPDWLCKRLEAIGLRPINNIVDISNYVMYELGHPLHIFDADKIKDNTIVVRPGFKNEKLVLLDDTQKTVSETDILICDTERPLALAGIMGCMDSGVSETTKNVIIECAYFEPSAIRKSSKKHLVASDSSYRFERGVDIGFMESVVERATSLVKQLGQAELVFESLDVQTKKLDKRVVCINEDMVYSFLGLKIEQEKIITLLKALGFSVDTSHGCMELTIPSSRMDLNTPADIYEELARLIGYDQVPSETPAVVLEPDFKFCEKIWTLKQKVRNAIASLGYNETINYSFVPQNFPALTGTNPELVIELKNPITDTMKVMRTELLPSLLNTMKYNISRRNLDLKLFEIGATYIKNKDFGKKTDPNESPALEKQWLCGLVTGNNSDIEDWSNKKTSVDFYKVKGDLTNILQNLRVPSFEFVELETFNPKAHPGASVVIKVCGKACGLMGRVHPSLLSKFDITEQEVYFFELDLDVVKDFYGVDPVFKELPKFPSIRRDLSFIIDDKVTDKELQLTIKKLKINALRDSGIFDLYRGKGVPEGKKSVAYYFIFSDNERTLTDAEADLGMESLIRALKDRFLIENR